MNKSKKILSTLTALTSAFTLAGCSLSLNKNSGGRSGNTIVRQNGNGNTWARAEIIYFNHIDGEGNFDNKDTNDGKLPATVTFVYPGIGENYPGNLKMIRYQVQYLACNCRSNDYNAWSTMYVEMSATKADLDNPDGSRIVAMSFGDSTFVDDYGHSTGVGHWGDSYAMDRNQNVYASEYAKAEGLHGPTFEDFKTEIVGLLTEKTYGTNTLPGIDKATLHDWMTNAANFNDEGFFEHENIEVLQQETVQRYTATLDGYNATAYSSTKSAVSIVDAYAGASVSLDNMLSVLDALFELHAKTLKEIKADPNNEIFYNEEPLVFTGTYHLEKTNASETIFMNSAAELQALVDDGGTYMIYAAKEGCSTCAAFSKAVVSYIKHLGVKIYEIYFTEAKTITSLNVDGNGRLAPQLFLINNGQVVQFMDGSQIDAAAESGSYLTIYNGFTKTLLAE